MFACRSCALNTMWKISKQFYHSCKIKTVFGNIDFVVTTCSVRDDGSGGGGNDGDWCKEENEIFCDARNIFPLNSIENLINFCSDYKR